MKNLHLGAWIKLSFTRLMIEELLTRTTPILEEEENLIVLINMISQASAPMAFKTILLDVDPP